MLTYYENAMRNGMNPQPNEGYRELQQAVQDDQWENTSARYTILEQESIGASIYNEVEAWLNYVVGQSSTGMKNGEDFVQLTFRSITHPKVRGRYYKFDNNIWLTHFTDEHDSLTRAVGVRRCNNALRWINPDNGAVETVPCVVDYDMSSPAVQVTQSILTPNNHAVVMIQGNNLTNTQLKTNMRFILGGRPFKLTGEQNALLNSLSATQPTLLYLDLYLDEKQANDNFNNSIAFNGHYNYTITPSQLSIEAMPNSIGKLTANVLLNGVSVIRPVTWESSNPDVIQIDSNGDYIITGDIDDTTTISVGVEGNATNVVNIPVTVVGAVSDALDIYISPTIDKIKEYETLEFEVQVSKYGAPYTDFTSTVSLDELQIVLTNKYLSISNQGGQGYKLSCKAFDSTPKALYVTVVDTQNSNTFQEAFNIKTVNMFG